MDMVALGGIEPPTHGSSDRCSTDWAIKPTWRALRDSNPWSPQWQCGVLGLYTKSPKMVAGVGFEPTTFRLWAWRANQAAPPRENYTHIDINNFFKNGGSWGIRTPAYFHTSQFSRLTPSTTWVSFLGSRSGDRTRDIPGMNRAL